MDRHDHTLYTGRLWHLTGDPARLGAKVLATFDRGALVVDARGHVVEAGDAAHLLPRYVGARRVDFGEQIILPTFVDAHLHFPQLDMIGASGLTLMQWLERHTFPEEVRFADPEVARRTADRLIDELYANGIGAVAIYGSVHLTATEALCEAAVARGLRAHIGKMSMDRGAPPELLVDAGREALELEQLITRWHGRHGRIAIALSPRFAPACSDALLATIGELHRRYPELIVQTHLAENEEEIATVARLFPRDRDYLAVYERHELVGPRTLLGHCVHLDAEMRRRVADAGAVVVHCPSSNLFLGSGLMPLRAMRDEGVRVTLASDIGAGTSLSPWRTMAAAAQVARLRGAPVAPAELLWMATLGGADALGLGGRIGNFEPGREADFQVIDWTRNRLLRERFTRGGDTENLLYALIHHADDRLTKAVYIAGERVWQEKESPAGRLSG